MAAIATILNENPREGQKTSSKDVRQGQMTEFLGTLRCATCVDKDYKCWIRESDEGCLLCTSTDVPCVFTRTVVKKDTKAAFLWNDLIEPRSDLQPGNTEQ